MFEIKENTKVQLEKKIQLGSSKNIDIPSPPPTPHLKFMEQWKEPLKYIDKKKMGKFLHLFMNTVGSSFSLDL